MGELRALNVSFPAASWFSLTTFPVLLSWVSEKYRIRYFLWRSRTCSAMPSAQYGGGSESKLEPGSCLALLFLCLSHARCSRGHLLKCCQVSLCTLPSRPGHTSVLSLHLYSFMSKTSHSRKSHLNLFFVQLVSVVSFVLSFLATNVYKKKLSSEKIFFSVSKVLILLS